MYRLSWRVGSCWIFALRCLPKFFWVFDGPPHCLTLHVTSNASLLLKGENFQHLRDLGTFFSGKKGRENSFSEIFCAQVFRFIQQGNLFISMNLNLCNIWGPADVVIYTSPCTFVIIVVNNLKLTSPAVTKEDPDFSVSLFHEFLKEVL